MKCFANKIDFCQLIQESWKSPTLDFGGTDIYGDSFEYKITSNSTNFTYSAELGNGLRIVDDKLIIEDPELKLGRYNHELIWVRDGIKTLLFQGSLTVTSKGGCNPNCAESYTIIADPCEETIEVSISQSNINIQGATIDVDSVETIDSDQTADVENVGTNEDVRLKFYIPKGQKGNKGDGIEVHWDGTKLGVRIEGQSDYIYSDLKGDTGKGLEFEWRDTELGARVEGDSDYVYTDLKGDKGDPLKFSDLTPSEKEEIKGDTGEAATINIGDVETVDPEEEAQVKNVGTENNAVLDFKIPKGKEGEISQEYIELLDEYNQEQIEKSKFIFKVSTIAGGSKTFSFQRRPQSDDYSVDWGDGYENENNSHTYEKEGIYKVTITPEELDYIIDLRGFDGHILEVIQWGNYTFNSASAFNGASNLRRISALDAPYKINTLNAAFLNTYSLEEIKNFSNWEIKNASSLSSFLRESSLKKLDVSFIDVKEVTSMTLAFAGMGEIDFDFSLWTFNADVNLQGFMNDSKLKTSNYDKLLENLDNTDWSGRSTPKVFDGGNSKYSSEGKPFRDSLVSDRGWTITDGGLSD